MFDLNNNPFINFNYWFRYNRHNIGMGAFILFFSVVGMIIHRSTMPVEEKLVWIAIFIILGVIVFWKGILRLYKYDLYMKCFDCDMLYSVHMWRGIPNPFHACPRCQSKNVDGIGKKKWLELFNAQEDEDDN